VTGTLAYYVMELIMVVTRFIVLAYHLIKILILLWIRDSENIFKSLIGACIIKPEGLFIG
jgi:hypothetical protein